MPLFSPRIQSLSGSMDSTRLHELPLAERPTLTSCATTSFGGQGSESFLDSFSKAIRLDKICCLGAGHVGGPTMAVVAQQWPELQVVVLDVSEERIKQWNSNDLPIFEPGLDEIVKECRGRNLFFSTDVARWIAECDVIFICVNTPTKTYGIGSGSSCDLTSWELATRSIAKYALTPKIVIEKSTVPVRTSVAVQKILTQSCPRPLQFAVLSNPEFMAEGTAVQDLKCPDRVLIGSEPGSSIGQYATECLSNIYLRWVPKGRIVSSSIWSAELAKLVSNALLAQRISSINSIAMLCDKVGADVGEVARCAGSDSRIGSSFLTASVGFGGSCLEKDILTLVYLYRFYGLAEAADYWLKVKEINDLQKSKFSEMIFEQLLGTIRFKKIAVFGFTFKKHTSDVRVSPAIDICGKLLAEGAVLHIVDPKAREREIRNELASWLMKCDSQLSGRQPRGPRKRNEIDIEDMMQRGVVFQANPVWAVTNAHAIVLLTDWEEFTAYNYELFYSLMEKPSVIFDGRNALEHDTLRQIGFQVFGIGVGVPSSQPPSGVWEDYSNLTTRGELAAGRSPTSLAHLGSKSNALGSNKAAGSSSLDSSVSLGSNCTVASSDGSTTTTNSGP